MASVAGSAEVWGYASGRVSPIPAAEGGGQELNLAALIHGHMAEELPWIKLFHADKSYAEFVNEVFFLSLDEEEAPPSAHVVEQLLQITPFAKTLLAQEWSKPWITTDGSGGLRLSWRRGARELRAVLLADTQQERYLYWQDGSEYGAIPNFGSATLFTRLRWLNGRNITESAA
jgi:hypothetical protein